MKALIPAFAAASALIIASPASAKIMVATFTGAITEDVLGTGAAAFGAPAQGLVGATYTMQFRYDTAAGAAGADANTGQVGIYGGSAYGASDPILGASITINGVTRNFGGGYQGVVESWTTGQGAAPPFFAIDATGVAVAGLGADDRPTLMARIYDGGPVPTDFTAPFEMHDGEDSYGLNIVQVYLPGAAGGPLVKAQLYGHATDVVVAAADPGAAVPEPASWALLITGFAGLGAALRRRPAPRAA